jgi:hypothetical protein
MRDEKVLTHRYLAAISRDTGRAIRPEGGFMKSYLKLAGMVLGVLSIALAITPAEASSCSQAALAGKWTYTYTGTIFTPNGAFPLASVGHFHQDSAGNVEGGQTRTVAGSAGVEEVSGIFTVNPDDCSATGTISALVGGQVERTAIVALAYDQDGNHVRGIFQSLTLPDGTNVPVVITVDGNRVNTKN